MGANETSETTAQPQPVNPTEGSRRSLIVSTTLLIGALVSFFVFQSSMSRERETIRSAFDLEVQAHRAELEENLRNYRQILIGLRVFFRYSEEVTRLEFRGASAELVEQFPGIQALEWIPRVSHSERAGIEAVAREEGVPEFSFTEKLDDGTFVEAGVRPEYWPILYAEPQDKNAVILGYDLHSAPTVGSLMDARDSGMMRGTKAFPLAQETGGKLGWIIICPVYDSLEEPRSVSERREKFEGYLEGVFRLPDLLNATWGDQRLDSVDTLIVDTTNSDNPQVIFYRAASFDDESAAPESLAEMLAAPMADSTEIYALGRKWVVAFRPGENWMEIRESSHPHLFLAAGLVLTLLVSYLVHFQLKRTELVEATVAIRTEELSIGHERLRLAMQSGRMCAWEWDVETDEFHTILFDASLDYHAAYAVTSRTEFLARVHPLDRGIVRSSAELAASGARTSYSIEFRIPGDSGKVHWIAEHGTVATTPGGSSMKMIGVSRDVTAEKIAELEIAERLRAEQEARSRAERAEREKEQALLLLDTFFRSAPVGLSLQDTDARFLRANDTTCRYVGRPREEIIGRQVRDVLGAMGEDAERLIREVVTTGMPKITLELEGPVPTRPSENGHWLVNHYPVRNPDGEIEAIGSVVIDVTDLRRAESEMRMASERFELLARATHDAVWDWDISTGKIWRNSTGTREAVSGDSQSTDYQAWEDSLHPDDSERIKRSLHTAIEGSETEWQEEYRIRRRDGTTAYVLDRGYIVRDESGRGVRMIGASTDVTERKEFENRIHQLNAELEQRVETRTAELRVALDELESFSYSVSHDLRAPLRALHGFAHIIREDQESLSEDNRNYLARVCSAAEHMDRLINDLLRLSRISRHGMELQTTDVSAIAKEVVAELRSENPDHNPDVRIEPGMSAECDEGLIRIVLVNLLGNAFKFTRNAESPLIEAGSEQGDADEARRFVVRDNGAGFDMSYVDQLFSPFRRLHSPKDFEGTGIGLATVRRIVRRHGGEVIATSGDGGGATFTFTLNT